MSLSPDEFHMLHGDKVRESLMMLEGHDGAFELLAHCHLPAGDGEQGRLYAIVRSTSTNRAHILVRRPESELPTSGNGARFRPRISSFFNISSIR
jgi:hypothetical protein